MGVMTEVQASNDNGLDAVEAGKMETGEWVQRSGGEPVGRIKAILGVLV